MRAAAAAFFARFLPWAFSSTSNVTRWLTCGLPPLRDVKDLMWTKMGCRALRGLNEPKAPVVLPGLEGACEGHVGFYEFSECRKQPSWKG